MWLPEVRQLLQRPTPDTLLAINMDNWVFSSQQANLALFSDSTSSLYLRISFRSAEPAKLLRHQRVASGNMQMCCEFYNIERGRFLSAALRYARAVFYLV